MAPSPIRTTAITPRVPTRTPPWRPVPATADCHSRQRGPGKGDLCMNRRRATTAPVNDVSRSLLRVARADASHRARGRAAGTELARQDAIPGDWPAWRAPDRARARDRRAGVLRPHLLRPRVRRARAGDEL